MRWVRGVATEHPCRRERPRSRRWKRRRTLLLAALPLLLAACRPAASPRAAGAGPGVVRVVASARIVTGTKLDGLEVGGLSALQYDRKADLFYAVVDDPTGHPPARLLRFRWHPGGQPELVDWVKLLQEDGSPLPARGADLEGLARGADGTFFVSSEGDADHGIGPWVGRWNAQALLQEKLPVPDAFAPRAGHGIHDNQGFEALTLLPGENALIAGTEGALYQDQPGPPDAPARGRILEWDLQAGGPPREWLYPLDLPVGEPRKPGGLKISGLVDLLPWPAYGERMLALERSFVDGIGVGLHLYEMTLAGAEEVTGQDALASRPVRLARKRLLADFGRLHVPMDNYEGMAWGPASEDGKPFLIVVCDNNFNGIQQSYLLALSLSEPPPL